MKAYGKPYLGISTSPGQIVDAIPEEEELVDKEVRERFKRMCEGYYDNVAKILVKEHNVCQHAQAYIQPAHPSQRLQEQDRRNHEAYIRSGEIFEDRQQAYEKMTKSYEKLLSNCQTSVIRTLLKHF